MNRNNKEYLLDWLQLGSDMARGNARGWRQRANQGDMFADAQRAIAKAIDECAEVYERHAAEAGRAETVHCNRCDGSGKLYTSRGRIECPLCGGTGRAKPDAGESVRAHDSHADPWCATCGHVASDHRGACGAPIEGGARCSCLKFRPDDAGEG